MGASSRVGIIADAHDHERNLSEFAARARRERYQEVWLVGDIGAIFSYHHLLGYLTCPIRAVPGNVEVDHDLPAIIDLMKVYPNLIFSPQSVLTFDYQGHQIRLQHELDSKEAFSQKELTDLALVISGHTHRPNLGRLASTHFVNPGTLSGLDTRATFATIDFLRSQADRPYWIELHHLYSYI